MGLTHIKHSEYVDMYLKSIRMLLDNSSLSACPKSDAFYVLVLENWVSFVKGSFKNSGYPMKFFNLLLGVSEDLVDSEKIAKFGSHASAAVGSGAPTQRSLIELNTKTKALFIFLLFSTI